MAESSDFAYQNLTFARGLLTLLKRALGIEETYTAPTQNVYAELDERISARIAPLQERVQALEEELGKFAA